MRACLCGKVGCKRHGRKPRTQGNRGTYGADHQARRDLMLRSTPEVCARCGLGPRAWDPWEAGHVEDVVNGGGPEVQREHRSCNRRAGAKVAHERTRQRSA